MLDRSTSFRCRRSSLPLALSVVSSGPNSRSLKAIWLSSVRRWSWKISTECSWKASKTPLRVASSIVARSTPSTRAPRLGCSGVTLMDGLRCRDHRPGSPYAQPEDDHDPAGQEPGDRAHQRETERGGARFGPAPQEQRRQDDRGSKKREHVEQQQRHARHRVLMAEE